MAMDTQEMEAPGGTPPIAVVILNWNGEKLLKEFLPKVVATTGASISRIIVADNGSTDGSLAYVADAFPENVEVMSFPVYGSESRHGCLSAQNTVLPRAGSI